MNSTKKWIFPIILSFQFFVHPAHAQLEVARMISKDFSAFGFGSFLNIGVGINPADEITGEVGFYYFNSNSNNAILVPFLVGYRHTLDGSGTGFYLEPSAGYNFGATDIQKTDAAGSPIYSNGNEVDQKVSGPMAGLAVGYIFQFPINLGLRYEHVFVPGDIQQNLVSLRVTYYLSFGRRSDY
jgi:hypothetical protein